MCWPECARVIALGFIVWATALQAAEPTCAPLQRGAALDQSTVEHGHGLLWRISGAPAGDSYVLGTMHIAAPHVIKVMDAVQIQFAASKVFAMEVVLDDSAMQTLASAMVFRDGRRLSKLVDDDLFAAIARRLAAYGVSKTMADEMKPWAAFTTMSMPVGSVDPPFDMQLMGAAQHAGKTVQGLESVAEQLAVFDSVNEPDQLAMLREVVCHYDTFQQELGEMVDAYVARDLAALVAQALRYQSTEKDAFMEKLLWARNVRMAERIAPLLTSGHGFIAIGALHLPGPRGVLHLLEAQGYRVEAVY
jgi:uncharacterized protein